MNRSIEVTVNGAHHALTIDERRTLLDVLRSDLRVTGPKYGCGLAQCGACTVLVGGAPARSCVMRAAKANGAEIVTLEGLSDPVSGTLHPVQQGFVDAAGAQCGYCLSGMVMTAVALLENESDPSEARVRDALKHNLCRCGTHKEIIASVMRASELMRRERPAKAGDGEPFSDGGADARRSEGPRA
ncbi:(2Fe-2S)-binding protein [Jiella mangrovi]|uniref:(2Fe-2S)-binding protein n=1 Tax=Jiella mangrovi TaxID=2821407 RepID=UPI001FD75551|nr:(2Fe-2S)-binding protein [Jiella mangrovi]